jgi:hypothetical protein
MSDWSVFGTVTQLSTVSQIESASMSSHAGVPVGVGEGLGLKVTRDEISGIGVGVGDRVGVRDGLGVGERLGVGVGDRVSVRDGLGVGEGLGAGVGVGDRVEDAGVGVGLIVVDWLGDGLGLSVERMVCTEELLDCPQSSSSQLALRTVPRI